MAKKATKPATTVFLIVGDRRVCGSLAGELKEAGYSAIDYQTAREFLIDKPNHSGGIVISELRLLGMQGLELVEHLAGERATFPVVLIVNNADTPKAVKAGVDFVCGPLSAEILIAAIQRANTPEEFSERDLQWFFDRLTPAESRVLDGVIAGKASRAIAAELGVSTKTVDSEVSKSLTDLSAEELRELLQASRQTLTSLVESLLNRPDMQNAIRRLMRPDDMLETFSELAVREPDLMRLVLQVSVAALVNVQSLEAVDAEMKRRAVNGN